MTHVKTGCMLNPNDLGVGMNSNMKDFVTSKERLKNKSTVSRYDLIALVIIVVVIGSLQSWL